jgi:outer membrane protein assembly factor BamB
MKLAPALLALPCCLACALAADWPQWRGPARDGRAPGVGLPAVWPEQPPKPLWSQKVGTGQASPVVAEERVLVLGRPERDREGCFCLDAGTGKVLWQLVYPCKFKPSDATAGEGPKSTPTVADGRAYTLGVAGMLHCLALASGKVLWQRDLHADFWGVARDQWGDDAYSTCCGAAASPLLLGDRAVLVSVGGKKAGAVTAFNRGDGKVLWKSPLTDRSSYASPILATLAGTQQLVAFTGLRMTGLKPTDGSLLWDFPFEAKYEQTMITPVIWKDRVIVAGEKKPTVALAITSTDNTFSAKPAWTNRQLTCYTSIPVVMHDHLVGLNARNQLVCIDLTSGKTAWAGGDFSPHASLVLAGDTLLVLTRTGELHALEANVKKLVRKARWRLLVKPPVWSHLAVAGARFYVKDSTDVICFAFPP